MSSTHTPGPEAAPTPPAVTEGGILTWPSLVLGSSSPYRADLLRRLGLPFTTRVPNVDESPLPEEAPLSTATRLALRKAHAVAAQRAREQGAPDEVVIGSDQVADLDGQALGKPGDHPRAVAQLLAMRGRSVWFHTAVAVVRPRTGYLGQAVSSVKVVFRALTEAQIETYLRIEQPYDCAGSARAEGLGTVLLEDITSNDPSALIGLPLIPLSQLLTNAGLDVLAWHADQAHPTHSARLHAGGAA